MNLKGFVLKFNKLISIHIKQQHIKQCSKCLSMDKFVYLLNSIVECLINVGDLLSS